MRRVLDPDPNVMPLVPRYQIWFYVPTQEGADLWDKKTKYRPDKLMLNRQENPEATGIFTLNHFLTVKFTLTRTHCIRTQALKLIKQIIQIDNNTNSPQLSDNENPSSAPPTPRISSTSNSENEFSAPRTPRISSTSNSENEF